MYQPGSTVLITDIGVFTGPTLEGAASSLVCDTSSVTNLCCRGSDNGGTRLPAEWLFPDGTTVPGNSGNSDLDFTRSGFTDQLRLNRRNNALMPTGNFTCTVPGATMMQSAMITLIAGELHGRHSELCSYDQSVVSPATVSIPSMLSVAEEEGTVSICATLAITPATATTSRNITVSLATSDRTGKQLAKILES